MKCFSSRQPWASLIVRGYKPVENRSWPINYRGPVLILAGKIVDSSGSGYPYEILTPALKEMSIRTRDDFPRGAIIGQVNIIDCVQNYDSLWAEPGKWHWVLANAKQFETPIPCPGRLGLFEAPDPTPKGLFRPHDGTTRRVDVRKEVPDVMITRPGKWGNPWKLVKRNDDKYSWGLINKGSKTTSIYSIKEYALMTSSNLYRAYIKNTPHLLIDLHELKGKRLGCFCPANRICHGDVLVKLVNELC